MVIGKITTWMVREYTLGEMGDAMKVSTSTIKSMVMENTLGLMDVSTSVNGWMGNSTERVNISYPQVLKKSDSGRKARESAGKMKQHQASDWLLWSI
jgi:hypothetical protein